MTATPALEALEQPLRLNDRRMERVVQVLREAGARSVLDLGCGAGRLIRELLGERQFERIVGVDASTRDLEMAHDRLRLDRLPERQRERVTLLQGALTYRDKRLAGFDAAAVVRGVEHIDPPLLDAAGGLSGRRGEDDRADDAERRIQRPLRALHAGAAPQRSSLQWTRAEFEAWAGAVAERFGSRAFRGHRLRPGPRTATQKGGLHMQLKIPISRWSCHRHHRFGKSVARHFAPTEVLSSDRGRGWVSDDETDQNATKDAFGVLHFIAGKRLASRRLAVVDATNVRPEDRKHLIELARRYHALPVTIVIDIPEEVCIARNKERPDRQFGAQVVRNQVRLLHKSLRGLQREGFRQSSRCPPSRVEARRSSASRSTPTGASIMGRSTSSATCMAASTSCAASGAVGLYGERHRPGLEPSRVAASFSSAISWTVARNRRKCCNWSWTWSRPARRCACRGITSSACCGSSMAAT
jgi:predicted kinase